MYKSILVFVVLIFGSAANASEDMQPEAYSGISALKAGVSTGSMVVSAHPLATQAGINILSRGGSAVDAAIAVQLVLTLVEPQSSGIGGGAFMMHFSADDHRLIMFDGREQAPSGINEAHFLEQDGTPESFWKALVGGHSVGVPGVVAMMYSAHEKYGNLAWSALFDDAIAHAEKGFIVSPRLNLLLTRTPHLDVNPTIKGYFFNEMGDPWPVGHRLKNPDYAKSLRLIAEQGPDAFYQGEIAQEIVTSVQTDPVRPGLLTLEDLNTYKPQERNAVCSKVWDYTICSASPPSSGGVTIIQQLKILEDLAFDFKDPNSSDYLHYFAASSNLAFADRNRYLADPDFVYVPTVELLNNAYLKQRSLLITPSALVSAEAGLPNGVPERITTRSPEQPSTSHFSIVDASGNVVSMTTSIEMAFGSRTMAGGFLLNNQLTDFDFVPRNEDGALVANSVAPFKRPRSSMSPTIVFDKNNDPMLVVGSPGGSRIINYTSQAILNYLKFGMSAAEAVAQPHIVARNTGVVEVEVPGVSVAAIDSLQARGYQVREGFQNSGLHMIAIERGVLIGGADPRREGTVGIGD